MKKNKNIGLLFATVCILGLFTILGWTLLDEPPALLQGEVEATQIKVASKVPGRIAQLLVQEGQTVEKGTVVLELESPEIEAKLQQATAARNAAQAQNEKASHGARKEQITSAYNMWQKAKAGAEFAQKTYDRLARLFKEGVIPEQKMDEAEARYKAAQVTELAAKAQYELAQSGARYEDKNAASALVAQANGAIAEVQAYLKETTLQAPISGEVSNIIAHQGELVNTGFPVITITDLNDIWVTFNIREDQLVNIKKGVEFDVKFPALGEELVRLKVSYIKVLGEYATWKASNAQGDFDRKTFEVRARPTQPVSGLRPGMSALVNWSSLTVPTKH